RHFEVTDASVHDSQMIDFLLDEHNTSADVWAYSATPVHGIGGGMRYTIKRDPILGK
ncbi:hypothetical protein SAMN05421721_1071, partial [Ectothiorhodospira mobilis]